MDSVITHDLIDGVLDIDNATTEQLLTAIDAQLYNIAVNGWSLRMDVWFDEYDCDDGMCAEVTSNIFI